MDEPGALLPAGLPQVVGMKYEPGMQIVYDVLQKGVFVEFRGSSHYLPGPFPDQKAAIRAAEEHCRSLGWGTQPQQS
jgi:hypothetical protein